MLLKTIEGKEINCGPYVFRVLEIPKQPET